MTTTTNGNAGGESSYFGLQASSPLRLHYLLPWHQDRRRRQFPGMPAERTDQAIRELGEDEGIEQDASQVYQMLSMYALDVRLCNDNKW